MAEFEESEPVPPVLLPCASCTRTFKPEALAKHTKYCEKTLIKKRKIFDSARQRIQGTDLAEFLPILTKKKTTEKSPVRKTQSKWKEKHLELVSAIRAARAPKTEQPPPSTKPIDHEKCPHCDRSFGPKAYDRHLEWCKEHSTRIQPKTPASIEAKERLEARTKYRAPQLLKSRRTLTREKYQPLGKMRDPSPKDCTPPPKSSATRIRDPSPMEQTRRSSVASQPPSRQRPSVVPTPKTDSTTNQVDSPPSRQQPCRNSKRHYSPLRKTSTTLRSKKCDTNGNNTQQKEVQQPDVTVKDDTLQQPKNDIFTASCNITSIQPKEIKPKIKSRLVGNSNGPSTPINNHNSSALQVDVTEHRWTVKKKFTRKLPVLNDIHVNDDITGMTVSPCYPIPSQDDNGSIKQDKIKEDDATCGSKLRSTNSEASLRSTYIFHPNTLNEDCELTALAESVKHDGSGKVDQIDNGSIKEKKEINEPAQNCNISMKAEKEILVKFLNKTVFNVNAVNVSKIPVNHKSTISRKGDKKVVEFGIKREEEEENTENGIKGIKKLQLPRDLISDLCNELQLSDKLLKTPVFGTYRSYCHAKNVQLVTNDVEINKKVKDVVGSDTENVNLTINDTDVKIDNTVKVLTPRSNGTDIANKLGINNRASRKKKLCYNCHKFKASNQKENHSNNDKESVRSDGNNTDKSSDLYRPTSRKRRKINCDPISNSTHYLFITSPLKYSTSSASNMYDMSKSNITKPENNDNCVDDDDNGNGNGHRVSSSEEVDYVTDSSNLDVELCKDCQRSKSDTDLSYFYKAKLFKCCLERKNRLYSVRKTFQSGNNSVPLRTVRHNDERSGNGSDSSHTTVDAYLKIPDFCGDANTNVDIVSQKSSVNDCEQLSGSLSERSLTFVLDSSNKPSPDSTKANSVLSKRFASNNEIEGGTYNNDINKICDEGDLNSKSYVYDKPYVLLEETNKLKSCDNEDIDRNHQNEENLCDKVILTKEDINYIKVCDKTCSSPRSNKFDQGSDKDETISQYNETIKEDVSSAPSLDDSLELITEKGQPDLSDNDEHKCKMKETEIVDDNLSSIEGSELNDIYDSSQLSDDEKNSCETSNSGSQYCFARDPEFSDVDKNTEVVLKETKSYSELYSSDLVSKNIKQYKLSETKEHYLSVRREISRVTPQVSCNIETDNVENQESLKCTEWETCSFLPSIALERTSLSKSLLSSLERNECKNSSTLKISSDRRRKSSQVTTWQQEAQKGLPPIINKTTDSSKRWRQNNTQHSAHPPNVFRCESPVSQIQMKQSDIICSLQNYDPYKCADRQMQELLGLDVDVVERDSGCVKIQQQSMQDKKIHVAVSQTNIISSPTSAFAKFTPIHPDRSPDIDSNLISPPLKFVDVVQETLPTKNVNDCIKDKNENPISLSSLSLCSSVSIDSIEYNRNNKKGLSNSAKTQSCDKKIDLPIKRSFSAVEPPRKAKDLLKNNLKMEHLLYGFSNESCDRFLGTPINDIHLNDSTSFESLSLSNESLKHSDSVDKSTRAEQELLKSMFEFEKLFESPSLKPIPPLFPSTIPFPDLQSHASTNENDAVKLLQKQQQIKGSRINPDSAYNSLNRRSPQVEDTILVENTDILHVGSSSGSECSLPPLVSQNSQVAKFCHECGAKYPVSLAKFCCHCGVRRLLI